MIFIRARVLLNSGMEVDVLCKTFEEDPFKHNNIMLKGCIDLEFELDDGRDFAAFTYSIPKENLLWYAVGQIMPESNVEPAAQPEPEPEPVPEPEPEGVKLSKNIGLLINE